MSAPPPNMPAQTPSTGKVLSKTALALIAVIGFFIIGLIYLFIFVYSGMKDVDTYWWSGLVGFIFAFVFYIVHSSIREEPVTRILSGLFFVLGAAFFYAAIGLNPAYTPGDRILWLIVLSIIVLVVLVLVWRMSMQRTADEERRARRQRT